MMTHGLLVDCCLNNNAYFVYWRSYSDRNYRHRWRWSFDKNPNHFEVVAQPNLRTYNASGGQTDSVLASIWFCKNVGQDHFFSTTTSSRCPTLENNVWETHLDFLQLKPPRQQYSQHYGHFFVSLARGHFVLCLWIQIFPLDIKLLICFDDYYDHK